MTQMCGDEKMLNAYKQGKDLYAEIASLAFDKPYEDCLEFYLDDNGNKTSEVNKEGKARRTQAKSILLGRPKSYAPYYSNIISKLCEPYYSGVCSLKAMLTGKTKLEIAS